MAKYVKHSIYLTQHQHEDLMKHPELNLSGFVRQVYMEKRGVF